MTTILINNQVLTARLNRVAKALQHPKPLGDAIANSFLTVTEDNFDMQGRPAWAGLSPVTLARRKAGKTLYQSGHLRRSISTTVNNNEVLIGTNVVYAATHQFGAKQGQYGKSSRGGPIPWGTIPARPFLPMDKNGHLQAEAETAMMDDVDYFYKQLFD